MNLEETLLKNFNISSQYVQRGTVEGQENWAEPQSRASRDI